MDAVDRTARFLYQTDLFITRCLAQSGAESLSTLTSTTERPPVPLEPVIINDFHALTEADRETIRSQFQSELGVASFLVLNHDAPSRYAHPLLELAHQLRNDLGLSYPLVHPLEEHPDAIKKVGRDGTLKVREVIKDPSLGYREQGETSEMFSMHHDGLGSGGTVFAVGLYMDSPPLAGGYTYFQNICRLSLELARQDREAFNDLFLPDALTVIRPRGKGALKVVCPVLYINEDGRPQSAFRTASGEYIMIWRDDRAPLARAARFLNAYAEPFSRASSFVHLTARGHGCFIRNESIAHGRTRFINRPGYTERVLARKWFMRHPRDTVYKHVPGMFLAPQFAELYPELFGSAVLEGEWRFDSERAINIREK